MVREQRRHKRYQLSTDAYAAFGRDYSKVGRIKDINLSGLSFVAINGEAKLLQPEDAFAAIYLAVNEFYLPDLPFRLVYRFPVHAYEMLQHSPIGLSVARYGVEFVELKETQKEQLEGFLESYGTNGIA